MKPPYYFNTAAKHIADKTNNTTAVIARITPATLFFSIKRLADVNALTRQPACKKYQWKYYSAAASEK